MPRGDFMNAYQAQRIRFGILAARHILERDRMTPDQVDYLEGCEVSGWVVGNAGTRKAFDHETGSAILRLLHARQ